MLPDVFLRSQSLELEVERPKRTISPPLESRPGISAKGCKNELPGLEGEGFKMVSNLFFLSVQTSKRRLVYSTHAKLSNLAS